MSLRIAILLLITLLGISCANTPQQQQPTVLPDVPARDLLLDTAAFPKGWKTNPCAPDCSRDEGNIQADRSFYIPTVPGHVIQEVFRLWSIEGAKAKFQTYREADFRERKPPNQTLTLPAEISYHSSIADEYYFGCGVDEVPICRVIARYDHYFVHVYFDVDNGEGDGLKLSEVEPILRALDARASQVLNISLITPISGK